MSVLDVYLHKDPVGVLERLDGARLRFAYDPEWLATAEVPISLSLPLREQPYEDTYLGLAGGECLPSPRRDDPVVSAIGEVISELADILRRAADEPA